MLNLILTLIVIAIPAYWVVLITWEYMVTPGTTWERLVTAFRQSATITWARLNGLSVALTTFVAWVSPLLGLPEVQAQILHILTHPLAVAAYIIFVTVGSEFARRRTL